MFRKLSRSVFFLVFLFAFTQIQAQELDEIKLAKILSKSDSIRKTLVYTGIVKLQNLTQGEQELLQVWRNKNEFYHHQSIVTKKDEKDTSQNDRRGPTKRGFFDFSFMPEQRYIKLLLDNYSVSFNEAKSVAGRKTMRLTIKPKHLPRFGLSIWFDKERFHILQREIKYYQQKSETLIFSMEYQNIQYDILPPDSLLKTQRQKFRRTDDRSARPEKVEYKTLTELKGRFSRPIYTPQFVPEGCELVSIKSIKDKHREVLEMHYADGILNLSMFQFWGNPPRFVNRMLEKPPGEDKTSLEFRQLFAVKKGEITFLFVGNFSVPQFKKMANSLIKYN